MPYCSALSTVQSTAAARPPGQDVSVAVADLDRHDAGVGRHAEEPLGVLSRQRRIGARLATGDDARHMGSVTVVVDQRGGRIAGLRRHVDRSDDLAVTGQTVDRSDPGVDHCDVDARTGDALFPQGTGADLVDDVIHRAERQVSGVDGGLHRWLDRGRVVGSSVPAEAIRKAVAPSPAAMATAAAARHRGGFGAASLLEIRRDPPVGGASITDPRASARVGNIVLDMWSPFATLPVELSAGSPSPPDGRETLDWSENLP